MLGQGVRVPWSSVPATVRDEVAALAGGQIVGTVPCVGGFSPGAAERLDLAGGGRAFVKAVSSAQNPDAPRYYRLEASVNAWLPAHPAVPRLLGTYDDGDWVALVFECVDASVPALPWRPADLAAVVEAARSWHDAATPASPAAPTVEEQYSEALTGWRSIAAGPGTEVDALDPWWRSHLDRLAEVEAGWAAAAAGDTVLHTDLRADNVLVRDGRAWLVDWPWASTGAPWVDAVLMAPSVALQGGPEPEAFVASVYPDAPRDRIAPVVAAVAGFFTHGAAQPAPVGLPTLREHQVASGRVSRAWLARLLG